MELDLEEVAVKNGSYLENKTLLEAQIPNKTGLTVLAIKTIEDGKMLFNPPVHYAFKLEMSSLFWEERSRWINSDIWEMK